MENDLLAEVRAIQGQGETELSGETQVSWGARLRGAISYYWAETREMLRDESSGPRVRHSGAESEAHATVSPAPASASSPRADRDAGFEPER